MNITQKVRGARVVLWTMATLFVGAVAVGMLFPRSDCGQPASHARTKNDATQIATAITAYVSEYGALPAKGGGNVNDAALMNILAGAAGPKNPREVVFLEIPRAKRGCDGAEEDGAGRYTSGFKDFWGNDYEVRVSADPAKPSVQGPDGEVRKVAIVWSRGDPRKRDRYEDPARWIKSWE